MRWKRRGVAGKLHLDMRELVGCLIWAEEGRMSGSTASRAAAADVQRRRGVPVGLGEDERWVSFAGLGQSGGVVSAGGGGRKRSGDGELEARRRSVGSDGVMGFQSGKTARERVE